MIQPTSSVGYGVNRTWRRTYSLGPQRQRPGAAPRGGRTRRRPTPSAASTTAPRSRPARSRRCAGRGTARARRRRSSWPASGPAGRGCPCSRPSGSSPRRRGSRAGSGRPLREVGGVDQVAGAADVEHDGDAGLLGPGPHAGRGRRGWASGPAGSRRRPAGPRRPCAMASSASAGGPVEVGQRARSRWAAGGGRRSRTRPCPRLWARAAPMARSRSPPCSQSRRRRLWNVLKTSWLEKPEQVEGPGAVLGQEAAGGREVLAGHDLGLLDGAVLVGAVLGGEAVERGVEVALLLGGVAGLAQLVAARVAQRLDPVADARVGVVAQPGRRLHDVGVGVVHDEPRLVVRHRSPPGLGRPSWREG